MVRVDHVPWRDRRRGRRRGLQQSRQGSQEDPAPNLQRCDENNRGTFWQVLQFGVQNLYDPELDEWLVMDTFEHRPGIVTLPQRCAPPH